MAKDIHFFELNTGAKIPAIGLGTWQADPGVVGQAVEIAIKVPPLPFLSEVLNKFLFAIVSCNVYVRTRNINAFIKSVQTYL